MKRPTPIHQKGVRRLQEIQRRGMSIPISPSVAPVHSSAEFRAGGEKERCSKLRTQSAFGLVLRRTQGGCQNPDSLWFRGWPTFFRLEFTVGVPDFDSRATPKLFWIELGPMRVRKLETAECFWLWKYHKISLVATGCAGQRWEGHCRVLPA